MFQKRICSVKQQTTVREDLDFYTLPNPEPSGGGGSMGSVNWVALAGWTVGWIALTAFFMALMNERANVARISEVKDLRSQSTQLQSIAKNLENQNQHNLKVWESAKSKFDTCVEQFNKDIKEVK